jgi:hypothetical protein
MKSERGEVGNAPYPKCGYPHGVVDEVREVVAKLWVSFSGQRCDGERTRSWRSLRWRLLIREGREGGREVREWQNRPRLNISLP